MPGKSLRTEKEFEWAGHEWRIPAVYSCGKGLVIDFCMRAGQGCAPGVHGRMGAARGAGGRAVKGRDDENGAG